MQTSAGADRSSQQRRLPIQLEPRRPVFEVVSCCHTLELFQVLSSNHFIRTLVAFYYGNMTRPFADPPRVGLKSTVPSNAGAELKEAVAAALFHGGVFPGTVSVILVHKKCAIDYEHQQRLKLRPTLLQPKYRACRHWKTSRQK